MRNLQQTDFVKHLGPAASPATVSRLFRGEVSPSERDLRAFSEVLAVPIDTIVALQILDSVPDRRMLATTGLLTYLASGSSSMLLAGLTLGLGIGHLRGVRSLGDSLLVDLVCPRRLAEVERTWTGTNIGDATASWLSVSRTLVGLAQKHTKCRIRLWKRESAVIDTNQDPPTGEFIANDWVAIEAPLPGAALSGHQFTLSFFGDSRWSDVIEPLRSRLLGDIPFNSHELVWDSLDRRTNDDFNNLMLETTQHIADLIKNRGD